MIVCSPVSGLTIVRDCGAYALTTKRPMNCVTRNIDMRRRVIVNLCFTLSPIGYWSLWYIKIILIELFRGFLGLLFRFAVVCRWMMRGRGILIVRRGL